MNVVGVKLSKPKGVDWVVAAMWGLVGGLIGAAVLQPLVGGRWQHIAGMALAGAASNLLANCGASFDKAGIRGILLSVVVCLIVYGAVVSL